MFINKQKATRKNYISARPRVSQKNKSYNNNFLSHFIPVGELPKKIEKNRSILRGPTSQLKYWPKIQGKGLENLRYLICHNY